MRTLTQFNVVILSIAMLFASVAGTSAQDEPLTSDISILMMTPDADQLKTTVMVSVPVTENVTQNYIVSVPYQEQLEDESGNIRTVTKTRTETRMPARKTGRQRMWCREPPPMPPGREADFAFVIQDGVNLTDAHRALFGRNIRKPPRRLGSDPLASGRVKCTSFRIRSGRLCVSQSGLLALLLLRQGRISGVPTWIRNALFPIFN